MTRRCSRHASLELIITDLCNHSSHSVWVTLRGQRSDWTSNIRVQVRFQQGALLRHRHRFNCGTAFKGACIAPSCGSTKHDVTWLAPTSDWTNNWEVNKNCRGSSLCLSDAVGGFSLWRAAVKHVNPLISCDVRVCRRFLNEAVWRGACLSQVTRWLTWLHSHVLYRHKTALNKLQ